MPAKRNPESPYSRYNPRRQGGGRDVKILPASGCGLPVPPLPKGREWSKSERARWRELWKSPQATMWDDAARGTVAVLITYESAIFEGSASAWQAQEARYAAESLGLTPKAMHALGWRIE